MAFLLHLGYLLLLIPFYCVKAEVDSEAITTLWKVLNPRTTPSIQLQALRRDILRKIEEKLEEEAAEEEEMSSLSSLATLAAIEPRTNILPYKRNLEALARAGYIKPSRNGDDYKRSIASLAKNGQLPIFGGADEDGMIIGSEEVKRGIESLARNGELRQRREIQELLDELENTRNLGELKRNIASIVRENSRIGKRNIASIKAQLLPKYKRSAPAPRPQLPSAGIAQQQQQQQRNKREAADYYDGDIDEEYQPVYQNQNVYDYEDLLKALSAEKRFLGSVAKSGWFRPSAIRYQTPDKRHIGALARLGWLPSFRNVRRFNRSGRSTQDSCREITANGAEDNAFTKNKIPLEGDSSKRFYVQPGVDRILLKKVFMHHPRAHPFLFSKT